MRGSRGGDGPDTTPPISMKNDKSKGFLGQTGPDPLENHITTNQAFNVGPSSAHQQRI